MAFPSFYSSAFRLNLRALPALVVAVSLLAGCKQAVKDPNDPKFIVAEKGTWTVTRAELNAEVDDILKQNGASRDQLGAKMPEVETRVLKRMVLKKLLLDKAATMHLTDVDKDEKDQLDRLKGAGTDAEFADQLKKAGLTLDELKARIHEAVIVRKVLEAEAFKGVEPTEQEIDDIYLKNKDSFKIPPKVRASRVLVLLDDKTTAESKTAKKAAIDAARARVMKGEDFGKVAAEVSEDRYSKDRSGDIGAFQKGENEPGFDDVAFNTKINTVSPVFLTPLGYQFLKVTEIHPAGVVPVADARSYISSKLKEMKLRKASDDYGEKLLASSGVTYHLVMVEPPAQMTPPPGAPGASSADQGAPPDAAGAPPAPSTPPAPAESMTPTPQSSPTSAAPSK